MNAQPNYAARIKREATNVHVAVSEFGLMDGAIRQPKGMLVRCPKHGDRTPSCSITKGPDATIRVHCFAGGCLSGDIFKLVAQLYPGSTFPDVLAITCEKFGLWHILDEMNAAPVKRERKALPPPPPPEPPAIDADTYAAVVETTLDLCPLSSSPHVESYLDSRGIFADAEAAGVRGYPADARALVAELLRRFDRDTLERASILRHGRNELNGHAWPLLVPWYDERGRIVSLQRRTVTNAEPRYRFPYGVPMPKTPYGIDLFVQRHDLADVAIVEGALDCLAYRRIARWTDERVAVLGMPSASSAASGAWVELLRGRRVFIAVDTDEPGEELAEALVASLEGVACETIRDKAHTKDWGAELLRILEGSAT